MGCRHSVAAAAAAPVSAEAKTLVTPADNDAADVERTSRLPVESSHNNNKASTKASLHPQQSGWEDFTSLYRVMKQVTGGAAKSGLSNIYLVVKHGSDEEPPATAATDEATTDESQKEDGTDRPHYEDDNLYIMQVIDIKSVAPERRKAMKKEIQSLKLIQHPNSK